MLKWIGFLFISTLVFVYVNCGGDFEGVKSNLSVKAHAIMSYPATNYKWGYPGTDIQNLTPTVIEGNPSLFAVSPPLPMGLSLDPSTGIIKGRPNAPSPSANYTVTATTDNGDAIALLTIEVFDSTQAVAPHNVAITGSKFVDSINNNTTSNVAVGTTIKWTNIDKVAHSVQSTATPKHFADAPENYGENGTQYLTVNMSGNLPYNCLVHGNSMLGEIVAAP